ncbi:MAG: 50S ribosomal protein L30, partial [Pseudomonadota bacterium]
VIVMSHGQIKVTLLKTLSGRLKKHIDCAHGLGLRKIRQSVVVSDHAANLGMCNKISYMIQVEKL